MTTGYLVIAASFLIVAVLLLILVLKPRLSRVTLTVLIPFCIWWSSALYFVPGQFRGFPKPIDSTDELPTGIVQDVLIQEDRGIYFTVLPSGEAEWKVNVLSFQHLANVQRASEPRIFVVPYSSELHRKLLQAQQEQGGTPGGLMVHQKGNAARPGENEDGTRSDFKILNPAEVLTKQ